MSFLSAFLPRLPRRRVYLDYASTTPLDRRAERAMRPFLSGRFANPSSIYREGVEAKKAVSQARQAVSSALFARPQEIYFTGSGTEANNLIIAGAVRAAQKRGERPHLVTTAIEHSSVLEICKALEAEGVEVTYVGVSEAGIVDPKDIERALRPNTALVTVMHANNEIGTIQPIAEIAKVIRRYRKESGGKGDASESRIIFHTDASQAANYLPLKADVLGVDAMTLDASKIYGPKGVGALYLKAGLEIESMMRGGGQEGGLRPGTENVPGIVGMAKALSIVVEMRERESARLTILREYLIEEILRRFPQASINGHRTQRLCNNVSVCMPGMLAEFAVIKLDSLGICAASASACKNLSDDSASYVIGALPSRKDCAGSSLRFTLGRQTTRRDIDKLLAALPQVFKK